MPVRSLCAIQRSAEGYQVDVTCIDAEFFQSYLRSKGIAVTVCLDAAERRAWLEVFTDLELERLHELLDDAPVPTHAV